MRTRPPSDPSAGSARRDRSFPWERLSAADAANLVLEHPGQAYTIGLLGVLDGDLPADGDGLADVEGLRRLLAPRVYAVPQLCRRLHLTSPGQGRPVWLTCPVDLAVHVRLGPRVEGWPALLELAGRLLAEPLSRDRPLWDLVVLPGPSTKQSAVVLRLHHAIADGVGAVSVMGSLFDPPTHHRRPDRSRGHHTPRPPEPQRPPTARELAAEAWWGRARAVAGGLARSRALPATLSSVRTGIVRTAGMAGARLPPTSLLGPVGERRGVAVVEADLDTLTAAARAGGGTVNDALLAGVAVATAALLASRGEAPPAELPVSVPVSLRASRASGPADGENKVGVMLVRLPLDEPDPARLVGRIAAATREAKTQARAAGTLELTRTRWGTHAMDHLSRRQRLVATFVTNVPGPAEALWLGGVPMSHAWPLSVIAGNVRLSVAALSYAGRLEVTVVHDLASTPDADVFADALRDALSPSGRSS